MATELRRFWKLGSLSRICTFSLLFLFVHCHTCKHQVPSLSEVVHKVYLKSERLTKRSSDQQLKITIIYDSSVDKINCFHKQLIIYRRHFRFAGKQDLYYSAGKVLTSHQSPAQAINTITLQYSPLTRSPSSTVH
ncbi:unnamed protein product [Oncorhynchus mykiss]|uniref:Uncharacterized protein n=1 Tax=Oncorhynchus mykiss TaxID=8022 RepID=A0A060YK89_ONCMY|nr:unnamed protein product [Oncorhynchus mykiss]